MQKERTIRKMAREFAISKKYHPDAYATKNVAKLIIEAYETGFAEGTKATDGYPSNFDNAWWGYIHKDGTIHTKRAFSWLQYNANYEEAANSPFVKQLFELFNANSREEAVAHILAVHMKTK